MVICATVERDSKLAGNFLVLGQGLTLLMLLWFTITVILDRSLIFTLPVCVLLIHYPDNYWLQSVLTLLAQYKVRI